MRCYCKIIFLCYHCVVMQSLWLPRDEAGCCRPAAYIIYMSRFLTKKVAKFIRQRCVMADFLDMPLVSHSVCVADR